jgi:hypothetical protein
MALTYTEITAIAQNAISKSLGDNIYGSNVVLGRMKKNAKKLAGGVQIQEPIIYSSSTSGGWYDDVDTLTISKTDNITAAVFAWRQAYESIRVSQLDVAKCSGDAAKLDLVASKMEVAKLAMADRLATGLFGNGGSDTIDGFAAMIDDDTYGGIAVADFSGWVAQLKGNSGTDRPLTLSLIQQLDGACTVGQDAPSFFVSRQNVFDEAYNLFQPHQRLEDAEVGKLGFKSLIINGKPLLVDSHAPAKTIYAVNEKYAKLVIHKDNDMRKEHHGALETTDSMLTKIFFMGNLVCSNRRMHGELTDIKVAA